MSMRRLELDFRRSGRRAGRAAWILLAAALAFAADLAWSWHSLTGQIAQQESLARGSTRLAPGRLAAPRHDQGLHAAAARRRTAAARDTLRRLSVPWDALFGALEAAQSERAWLLSIEPDVQNGTVTLTGEARDYLAALSYVANLESQKALSRVHLAKHETRQKRPATASRLRRVRVLEGPPLNPLERAWRKLHDRLGGVALLALVVLAAGLLFLAVAIRPLETKLERLKERAGMDARRAAAESTRTGTPFGEARRLLRLLRAAGKPGRLAGKALRQRARGRAGAARRRLPPGRHRRPHRTLRGHAGRCREATRSCAPSLPTYWKKTRCCRSTSSTCGASA